MTASPIKPSELLDAARGIAPVLEAEAQASEELGTLNARAVEALVGSGLYDIMLPRELGGAEADPVTQALVFEELSRADGSAGWCVMAGATCSGMAGAYCGETAIDSMFGGRRNVVMGGHAAPLGQAAIEDSGYRVNGSWHFGSGTGHADWLIAGCVVADGDGPVKQPNGMPEIRVVHARHADVQFLGNWDVMGLRGTGSFDYALKDLFVPAEFTYAIGATEPLRGGALYRMGLVGLVASGHAAFALGVARRALDEIAAISQTRARMGAPVYAEQQLFQDRFAKAEASLRAARLFVLHSLQQAWDTVRDGGPYGLHERALVRLATSYGTAVAADVVTFAYRSAGTQALRVPNALQRCFRDINAATQHAFVDDSTYSNAAKVLLGIAPENLVM